MAQMSQTPSLDNMSALAVNRRRGFSIFQLRERNPNRSLRNHDSFWSRARRHRLEVIAPGPDQTPDPRSGDRLRPPSCSARPSAQHPPPGYRSADRRAFLCAVRTAAAGTVPRVCAELGTAGGELSHVEQLLFGLVDLGHRLTRQQGRHRTAQRTSGTDHRRRSAGRPQAVAGTGGTGSCSRIGGVRRLLRGTAFRSREQLGHGDHADNLPLDDQLNRLRLSQDRGGRVLRLRSGPPVRGGRTPRAGGRRR